MPRAPSRIILESIVIARFSIIIFSFYGNFKYNKQVRIDARDSLSIKRFSDGDVDLNIWTDLKETRCQYPPPLQHTLFLEERAFKKMIDFVLAITLFPKFSFYVNKLKHICSLHLVTFNKCLANISI